jgi:hypothetical protein
MDMRSRLRSELTDIVRTKQIINKIKGLFADKARRVEFQIGNSRFNAADCTSVVIDETLSVANFQFKRPGGSVVENYDLADLIMVRRLRTKKYLIHIDQNANPA